MSKCELAKLLAKDFCVQTTATGFFSTKFPLGSEFFSLLTKTILPTMRKSISRTSALLTLLLNLSLNSFHILQIQTHMHAHTHTHLSHLFWFWRNLIELNLNPRKGWNWIKGTVTLTYTHTDTSKCNKSRSFRKIFGIFSAIFHVKTDNKLLCSFLRTKQYKMIKHQSH